MSFALLSDGSRAHCVLRFAFYRRILSICPHKDWSTPSEILDQRVIHNRYIIQLRVSFLLLSEITTYLHELFPLFSDVADFLELASRHYQ